MSIQYKTGNLLDDDAEILVNTVNCVGVMGKGIALEFKKRYPNMFDAYRNDCIDGFVKIGTTWWFGKSPRICCFPTKKHWRDPSKIEWIQEGLCDLRFQLEHTTYNSIAIPKLGCANGGLDWSNVKPLIINTLSDVDIDIRIYE